MRCARQQRAVGTARRGPSASLGRGGPRGAPDRASCWAPGTPGHLTPPSVTWTPLCVIQAPWPGPMGRQARRWCVLERVCVLTPASEDSPFLARAHSGRVDKQAGKSCPTAAIFLQGSFAVTATAVPTFSTPGFLQTWSFWGDE